MIDAYGRILPDYTPRPVYNYQHQEVIKVNGKNGADAYQLAPNSSALLLDSTEPIVWLKTTDGAGYPTCVPYTITPYEPKPEVNVSDLVERIEKLEGIINGKSNLAND